MDLLGEGDEDASAASRIGPGMTRAAPAGGQSDERLRLKLVLARELRPEARRAKDRPCGIEHVALLLLAARAMRAIGAGLYACRNSGVKDSRHMRPVGP